LSKTRILFRTSGGRAPGKQLGMGHIFRCLNLANYLKNEKIFFLIEDYSNVKKIISKNGFNCYKLKKNICLKDEIIKTKKFIEEKNINIVIIDKFDSKQKFIKEIRKISKVVVVSDLEKMEFPSDLVVNGFVGFKNKIKKNKFGTKCLLGPKFQILNKSFSSQVKNNNKPHDLLVTLGGFDEQNIIELILKILTKIEKNIKVKIILGPATVKNKKIIQLEKNLKNVKIIQKTQNMRNQIASARFGICSGGITSYEFASMNVPFGIISLVKHQTKTACKWEEMKIAKNLGLFGRQSDKKIEDFILEMKSYHSNKKSKQNIVDGNGGKRVSKEILKLS